jgi:hypothetical protein
LVALDWIAAPMRILMPRSRQISHSGMSWVNSVVLPPDGRRVDDGVLAVGGVGQLDDLVRRLDLPRQRPPAGVPQAEALEALEGVLRLGLELVAGLRLRAERVTLVGVELRLVALAPAASALVRPVDADARHLGGLAHAVAGLDGGVELRDDLGGVRSGHGDPHPSREAVRRRVHGCTRKTYNSVTTPSTKNL